MEACTPIGDAVGGIAGGGEAKERRLRRFVITTPPEGAVATPPLENNPIFPMTLDLRWPAPVDELHVHALSSSKAGEP